MIRIVKVDYDPYSGVQHPNTKDFDIPELEKHLKDTKTGFYFGLEIIEDEEIKFVMHFPPYEVEK